MTEKFVTLPREVVERTLEAFADERAANNPLDWHHDKVMMALRAALDHPQVEQKLVPEHELKDVRCECCGYMTHQREHMGCIRAVQPRGKPLSYEKIRKAWNDAEGCRYGYEDFARAIERAHGIEGEV